MAREGHIQMQKIRWHGRVRIQVEERVAREGQDLDEEEQVAKEGQDLS